MRLRASRSFRARITLAASTTPRRVAPLGSVATYLYFGNAVFRSLRDVDAADHFWDGRDVFFDRAHGFVPQRPHSVADRQVPQFIERRAIDDELLHLRGHSQELVHADPPGVSGLGAEVATDPVCEDVLGLAAPLL